MRNGGVAVGVVKDLRDPRNLGRIKVHFTWLDDSNRTHWARVATLMSGANRGSWFMPELEDEVLLAFDHGDMQHPYVVGYLWNGRDRPPNQGIDTRVRRIRTVSGHVIDLDDRGGQEKVLIKTQGENTIEMKDTPTKSIRVETAGGHHLLLDDAPPGTVELKTRGGRRVTLIDTPPSITIQHQNTVISISDAGITVNAPTAPLTVTCLQATIAATSAVSVTAPVTTFTGVVQASAVVSPFYTPGVGNFFGL